MSNPTDSFGNCIKCGRHTESSAGCDCDAFPPPVAVTPTPRVDTFLAERFSDATTHFKGPLVDFARTLETEIGLRELEVGAAMHAMRLARQETEAVQSTLAARTAELEEARKKQSINTHVRLFDLVRYQRAELHQADLIDEDEYAWLCSHTFPNDPKQGSPSPRRLEDYDELKAQLTQAKADGARLKDCAEYGWTIIANASGGNWDRETKDWQEAAARFRAQYYACLDSARAPKTEDSKA